MLEPLYLNADDEDLNTIASLSGQSEMLSNPRESLTSCFTAIVINRASPQDTFEKFRQMANWSPRKGKTEHPPFLALLLLSVVAAEQMQTDSEFAATNYYGRLCEVLGLDPTTKDKVGTSYRKNVAPLWDLFNEWIAANDELGVPTALTDVVAGVRDFVGVPIGQALIRSTDQQAITIDFFEKLFNDQGTKELVDQDELIENLGHWIASGNAGHRLSALWSKAQKTIGQIVIDLFDRWTPSQRPMSSAHGKPRLRLGATISSGLLGAKVTFELCLSDGSIEDAGQIELSIGGHAPLGMLLVKDPFTDSSSLVNLGNQAANVLASPCELKIKSESATKSHTRSPRAVTPFKEVAPNVWREQSLMRVGETYSLVMPKEIGTEILGFLGTFGQGGRAISLAEMPSGWLFVHNYTPTKSTGCPPLIPLQPYGGPKISLVGGSLLPGGSGVVEYQSSDPPMIAVFTDPPLKEVVVTVEDKSGVLGTIRATDQVPVAIPSSSTGLLFISAFEGKSKKPFASRKLFLRDADHPRSFSDALALRFNTTGAVECQKVSTDETSVAVVKGATLVSGALPLPISQAGLSSLSDRCADGQEEWQHDFHADEPTDAAMPGRLAQCVYDRSARHLKTSIEFIEPYRKKRFQESRCQDCGAVEFIDTRRRLKTDAVLKGGPEKAERPSPIPIDIQTSPLDDDFDRGRIEDRLWALGAGRIHELGILRDLSPVGNFNEALWNLCVSGHIDFEGMERDDLGGSWSTTPPTLIQHPRGFRLVGHRSSRVLQSLAKLLQRADVALQEHTPADQAFFSDVFVPTVDVDQMQQLLRTISGELGENPYNISLAGDLPNRFLESLPSLDRLVKQLPTCSYVDVSGHTEVFDLSSIRWTRKSTVSLVGKAIKEPLRGTTYFYVSGGDPMGYQAVSCGYRLAKHLAALSNRTCLVSYDKENSELVTPLGAELPLLYSRGVIFRTGHLPFKRGARRVYPNVDVGTAEIIEQQFSTTHP